MNTLPAPTEYRGFTIHTIRQDTDGYTIVTARRGTPRGLDFNNVSDAQLHIDHRLDRSCKAHGRACAHMTRINR